MNSTIVAFPTPRVANSNAPRLSQAAATIVSLDRWTRRARPHRTAHGVFFMTRVLTTTGDFA
ncbi:MAG: hypothetical protein VX874_00770 [Pseudomonadota bacterium]|nr:hypothetical protein [Pseudomonadota bacterium]